MKEATKPHTKKCPVCKKEYPQEDNYCGEDGSVLEQGEPQVPGDFRPCGESDSVA